MYPLLVSSLIFAAGSAASIITTEDAPLLGPLFISNFDNSNSKAICDAKEQFPKRIEQLFSSGELNKTDLTFTIDVFSAATNSSIYSYQHVGEGQERFLTAGKLDDQTVARIGSVTKLFTVYAIIAKAGIEIFSHPVTRYLPELSGNSNGDSWERISWDDVTIGALASQQAGSGGAIDFVMKTFEKYADDLTKITPEVLFKFMRDEGHPVTSPFRTAVYSDGGFLILGQVLARISGQSYADALNDILYEPLGLHHLSTTALNGSDVNAINRSVLGPESTSWAIDIPILAGSGGMYGNAADLRTTGLSILNSELLSPATTQEWMKPRSGTGSLVELVGTPWEITRLMIPVTPGSNRTRICDVYLKAGGSGDYTTVFGLSPDHGIGFSILVAGTTATPARWPLRDAVGELFVPAAEHAAVENADKNLAGTFIHEESEGNNMTLTVDEGQPGLGLESFFLNGTDKYPNFSKRLYPVGINSFSKSLASLYKTNGTMSIVHRMIMTEVPRPPRSTVEGGAGGLFDHTFAWMNLDGSGPIDEFTFEIIDGRLMGVKATENGLTLKRIG